ncbi:MAG TPA: aminotransferase class V-fold PLP-dependent enzyme, partial [Candidatus Desulfofervidus auxilii]|nr:aminotransferase class V-fold PLP-dependent enzyme [Candidatus Desulfofervidus auxilii]
MIFHSKPTIEIDDIKAVKKILESGMIAEGEKVKELENKLCNYIGGLKAKATCTGRSALVLGLWTLGIEEGDEVILPTYVCHSVMDAVVFVGAKPVIVDIGDDYCVDPEEVKKHITSKTKVITVVHIFGISAKIKELKKIAEEKSLYLIEDCAQAIGGEVDGRKLGSFGDISFFSFQATKVIATGEGGMLLVNNFDLLENFMKVIKIKGNFFRMSDIQAVLGLNQLNKLEDFIRKRREIAKRYIELFDKFT